MPTVPGRTAWARSTRITSGANQGTKTDASDSDQANYDVATRTLFIRLGTGANGTVGGQLAPGASTTIKFKVTIDSAQLSGIVANQGFITAKGLKGAPRFTLAD